LRAGDFAAVFAGRFNFAACAGVRFAGFDRTVSTRPRAFARFGVFATTRRTDFRFSFVFAMPPWDTG
jgi:hypothetical protein